ncbi:hypothetical protein ACET3Z_030770 [Daucus carota]
MRMAGFASIPNDPTSSSPLRFNRVGPTPLHLITTSAALRLGDVLRRRFTADATHLGLVLNSSIEEVLHRRIHHFDGYIFLQRSYDAWAAKWSSTLLFFGGEGSKNNYLRGRNSQMNSSRKDAFSRRGLTTVLIAVNVVVYLAQMATQGKLMLWGAKINSLIDRGQLWRLVSSSFLHANIGHLLINCYSLNSIGPTVEKYSGPGRYMAIYFISAVAASTMSYWFCKAPAVGASGAIFGLVGSYAMFIFRHRYLSNESDEGLQHVARIIMLNAVIGLMSKGIDNWGHFGGFIGGVGASWLLGPAWEYKMLTNDKRRAFVDKAPIFSLIRPKRRPS